MGAKICAMRASEINQYEALRLIIGAGLPRIPVFRFRKSVVVLENFHIIEIYGYKSNPSSK